MRSAARGCVARSAFARSPTVPSFVGRQCGSTFVSRASAPSLRLLQERRNHSSVSAAASPSSANADFQILNSDLAFPFAASEDTWEQLQTSRPSRRRRRGEEETSSVNPSPPESKSEVALHVAPPQQGGGRASFSAVDGLKELRGMQSDDQQLAVVRLLLEGGAETPPMWRKKEQLNCVPSLSGDVLACLHALELECMYSGLLLADVPRKELFSHLRESRLPGEAGDGPCLLNAEWIQRQKEELYGSNFYPVPLRWSQRPLADVPSSSSESSSLESAAQECRFLPSSSSLEEAPSLLRRRQVVAERSVWRRLTEEVRQQTEMLCRAGRIAETAGAKRVWIQWIKDMEPRIAALQKIRRRKETDAYLLPPDLEPALLAVIAVRTSLQALLVPKALASVLPSKTVREDASAAARNAASAKLRFVEAPSSASSEASFQKSIAGGVESRAFGGVVDLQPRQALVTQLAMAIGDAVYTETAASRLDAAYERELQRRGIVLFKHRHLRAAKSNINGTVSSEGEANMIRWTARKRLCVGGILLKELLQCSFFEAPYLAAKEELASELRQLQADECRISMKKKQRQAALLSKSQALMALSEKSHSEASGMDAAEKFVEAKETAAAAFEAGRSKTQEMQILDSSDVEETCFDERDIFLPRGDDEHAACLRLLETYRSRRSKTKVELPAFKHRVVYCSQTRKKYGILEMRRLCFDQMVLQDSSHEEEAEALAATVLAADTAACKELESRTDSPSSPSLLRTSEARRKWTSFWLGLKHPPMLVNPLPWKSHDSGGYLLLRSAFVRCVVDTEISTSSSSSSSSTSKADVEDGDCTDVEDGGRNVGSEGERECRKKQPLSLDEDRRRKKTSELFLGWPPRAKAKQDFSVYDTSFLRRAVDGLGSVPWQVSLPILRVMEKAWMEGGDLGRMPPRKDDCILSELKSLEEGIFPKEENDSTCLSQRQARARHLRQLLEKNKSERPSFLLKLRAAEEFSLASQLFFPHNIDFRGRCYPVPPHLNHMGDDVCRALLRFARARPLGERGWFWLKVHLSNLFGINKVPFKERANWTEERLPLILKVAENPLLENSKSFWLKADDPWQALAAVFEIAEAVKSGDVFSFPSQLPVHLDGSCNGLQHYAALGRDLRGGSAVNLTPADSPRDVYSDVLSVVRQAVFSCARGGAVPLRPKLRRRKQIKASNSEDSGVDAKCAESEREMEQRRLCELSIALDVLQRVVVKQTVMTICYGVTAHGAREQISRQLELLLEGKVDHQEISRLATFLSQLVLQSIGQLFECAMRIKVWLDKLSRSCGRAGVPVAWRVPVVGLLCEQPYRQEEQRQLRSVLQRHTLVLRGENAAPARGRQRQAFPPNFIHSLDAAHMLLTAHDCLFTRKIDFAAVHDSYWTHAGDADDLGKSLRLQFVKLYEEDPLALLFQDFKHRLGDHAATIEPPPPKGTLDVRQVIQSPYFFH